MLNSLILSLLTSLSLVSALTVVTAANAIHSVFSLIFTFVNVAGILLIFRVEFLATLLIVVYVGAVAVLFLFVVMMLNLKNQETLNSYFFYAPLGFIIGLGFVCEILFVLNFDLLPTFLDTKTYGDSTFVIPSFDYNLLYSRFDFDSVLTSSNNVELIGSIIYIEFFYPFILAGVVLLLAMVGAIVLTLHKTGNALRQDIFKQVSTITADRIRFTH